jgi:hypothetical protein
MEKEPRKRYPGAEAVIAALAPLLPGLPAGFSALGRMSAISETFVGRGREIERIEALLDPACAAGERRRSP